MRVILAVSVESQGNNLSIVVNKHEDTSGQFRRTWNTIEIFAERKNEYPFSSEMKKLLGEKGVLAAEGDILKKGRKDMALIAYIGRDKVVLTSCGSYPLDYKKVIDMIERKARI